MEQLVEMVRLVPPFTRYWSSSILVTSIVTASKLTLHMNLIFKPDKIYNEPWRLVTSFCYINDFSLQLVFLVWMISQSCRNMEEQFSSHKSLFPPLNNRQLRLLDGVISRYKSADFVYYIFQICCSVVLMVSFGYYYLGYKTSFLAPILEEIILYLWCRTSPHLDINVFGLFNIRRAYLPWFTIGINLLFNRTFLSEILLIILGDYQRIFSLLKDEYFWKIFVSITLSHFWWFVREFALNDLYFNTNPDARRLRSETLQKYGVTNDNWIRRTLVVLLTPPWYYRVLKMIKNIPDDPPEEENQGHNGLDQQNQGQQLRQHGNEIVNDIHENEEDEEVVG